MRKTTPYHHGFLSGLEGWDKAVIICSLLWMMPDPLATLTPKELIAGFITPDDLIPFFIPSKSFTAPFQMFEAVLVIYKRFP